MPGKKNLIERKKEATEEIYTKYEAQYQEYLRQNWPIMAVVAELEKLMKLDLESKDKILQMVARQYLDSKQRIAKYQTQLNEYERQNYPFMAGLNGLKKDMKPDLEHSD